MVTPPNGWRRYPGVNLLLMVPPDGRGRIRFHDRLAPRSFDEVVRHLLDRDPGFRATARGPTMRVATAEGEYAAWCKLDGEGDVDRWICAVVLDDFVAALDAVAPPGAAESVAPAARRMLDQVSFGLGVRRRRFLYSPPPGWLAVPNGLVTTYYPPGFPRRRAMLVVYPAEPRHQAGDHAFDELLADEERRGFARSGPAVSLPFTAQGGLGGRQVRYAGAWPGEPALARDTIILVDGRYRYVLRLEVVADEPPEDLSAALVATASSVRPLPQGNRGTASSVAQVAALTTPWLD